MAHPGRGTTPGPAPHLCHAQGPPAAATATGARPAHTPCSHALLLLPPSSFPPDVSGQPVPAGDSARMRETRSKSPSTASTVSTPPYVTDRASGCSIGTGQTDSGTFCARCPKPGPRTIAPVAEMGPQTLGLLTSAMLPTLLPLPVTPSLHLSLSKSYPSPAPPLPGGPSNPEESWQDMTRTYLRHKFPKASCQELMSYAHQGQGWAGGWGGLSKQLGGHGHRCNHGLSPPVPLQP